MSEVARSSGDETAKKAIDRLNDYTVVDCDIHEVHDHTEFLEYMDEPWQSKMRHLLRSDEPLATGPIGTAAFNYNGDAEVGIRKQIDLTTPDSIHDFMERMNTDYVILHGQVVDFCSNMTDPRLAAAFCSAYNDYMLDNYLDEYDGFKCAIRVPIQAPEKAAEEIDRLADEDDMVSVGVAAGATEPFGKPRYKPMFRAAADHGLPMDYHVGWPTESRHIRGGPVAQSSVEEFVTFNQHMMAHVPSVIFQGVAEEFPTLDHVFVEGGFTWLPSLIGRMDKAYERRKHDLPWMTKPPSEYISSNCYFGTHPIEDSAGVGNLIKMLDAVNAKDSLVYTSDYPHGDFDYPSILTIPEVSDEVSESVFGKTAMEVYDI